MQEDPIGEALLIKAVVSDTSAVIAMSDQVERAMGGVDVAVNCEGVLKLARLADFDDQIFDQTIAVNLKGTFNVSREARKKGTSLAPCRVAIPEAALITVPP
ncbi:SDR family NAD(P)-dependent oxidoreductase [Mesorhizobium sp. CAU 1741]|uniref:SDR family NAD(P)-dependent oxidoreductase n=1 Tax=Mesorhizobium sp. CAU 1741 TaxID=3140366 RepID=UPI00325A4BA1